jgi:hypothetical protein
MQYTIMRHQKGIHYGLLLVNYGVGRYCSANRDKLIVQLNRHSIIIMCCTYKVTENLQMLNIYVILLEEPQQHKMLVKM